MLSKVFDLFTQVDRSIDRSQGGLGIGLTLVRRLVEMHGGSVQAFSDGPGKGSQFVVSVPELSHLPIKQTAKAVNGSASEISTRRVLIVDDNADAAKALARLLKLDGHDVVTCFDGISALATASTFVPEYIFLDIGLPGMDGYEVARNLRSQPATERMVLTALTGYGRADDRRRAQEAGFNHHLVKPVDFSTLLAIISSDHHSPMPKPGSFILTE
jgi:two-component system CheB/CheR fusion protein